MAEIPEELLDADHRSGYGLSSEHGDSTEVEKGQETNTSQHLSTSFHVHIYTTADSVFTFDFVYLSFSINLI